MAKIRVKKGKGGGALNSNDNGILFNSERNKDHVCRSCVGGVIRVLIRDVLTL